MARTSAANRYETKSTLTGYLVMTEYRWIKMSGALDVATDGTPRPFSSLWSIEDIDALPSVP